MNDLRNWIPLVARDDPDESLPHGARVVLSQIDGETPVHVLSERTGLAITDLIVVLGDLVTRGAIPGTGAPAEIVQLSHAQRRGSSAPSQRPPSISPYDDLLASLPSPGDGADAVPAYDMLDGAEEQDDDLADLPELEIIGDAEADDLASLPVLEVAPVDDGDDLSALPELEVVGELLDDNVETDASSEAEAESSAPDDPEAIGSYRQLFETSLHALPIEARVEWGHTASGDVLCALCFDPMPGVIQAVFENPNTNLTHARLIAEHHRHPVGLDTLGRRSEYVRDASVRRLLLRNQQASERLLGKMLMALPLPQAFRATVGHELTDRARRAGRIVLRHKFDRASAEEKVGLIVQTEGRCLASLIGLTFDQKTTALLCRRTYQSSMIIQSLARFSAAPPMLLVHLLKQQVVIRNAHLKKMLQQHSNCPKYLKR